MFPSVLIKLSLLSFSYTETINSTTAEEVQVRKNFWCIEKIRCSELQPEKKEVVHSEVKALKNARVDRMQR